MAHGMNKKVTFSQVVDQLTRSMSDSSSLSDVSFGEEFKQNVTGSNPAKRSRKLYKPNRRPRPRPPVKPSYNGTSGSEEVWESSMESIESSSAFTLKPQGGQRKLNKIS